MAGEEELQELRLEDLPVADFFGNTLYKWNGFWLLEAMIKPQMAMKAHFEPHPGDVLLASFPKTGTTWLKALIYTILHPESHGDQDQLLKYHPQELVPFIEMETYSSDNPHPDLSHMTNPRIFNTHLPYQLLPDSIKNSETRIVAIARNPMDTFVSAWHFFKKTPGSPQRSFEEIFDAFCDGKVPGGHFFEHVLGYWNAREKMFFIKYEELKEDPHKHVGRLAQFLGRNMDAGEVEDVVWRCSLERLTSLKAHSGKVADWRPKIDPKSYFRRGVVGDWKNHLTKEMVQKLDEMSRSRLEGSGLVFDVSDKAKACN